MDIQLRFKQWTEFLAYFLPFCAFVAFVLYLGWMSYSGNVIKTVTETKLQQKPMEDLTVKFEKTLQENFYRKYDFIDLAGKGAKSVGLNTFNRISRLGNGLLTGGPQSERNVAAVVKPIAEFNDFLKSRGIPFLYIVVPDKWAVYDASRKPGYESASRANYILFVEALKKAGVDTMDMDALFREAGLKSRDLYFRTDHHWNLHAGQFAAQKTMEHLSTKKLADYKKDWLQSEDYRVENHAKLFLGSQGRRVGPSFSGIDDFKVYYPKYPTGYRYAGLSRGTSNWTYNNSILNTDALKRGNLFTRDPNSFYVYGEYPLQYVHNSKGFNDLKVLILGDSFRRAWQYFINSQFKEMDHVHMRYYTDGTVAQFIEQTKPDLVIMMVNSAEIFNSKYFDFGVPTYQKGLDEASRDDSKVALGDFAVAATPKQSSKFTLLPFSPSAGKTYTLTNTSTSLENSKEQFVQMTLQNLSTNQPVFNRYFDANSKEPQKWIFSVPEKNSDTFGLYLYAGTKGHTQDAKASIDDIQIQKGIVEDKKL